MTATPLQITLVDDSDLAAAGLTTILEPYADRVVVVDNREAIAHPDRVDVVLYEPLGQTSMARSLLRDLQRGSEAEHAVFSWAAPGELPTESTTAYLSKSLTAAQLVVSVEQLAEGRFENAAGDATGEPSPPQHGSAAPPEPPPARPGEEAGLTPRECEIVGLIVAGMSNREIGEALTLSINSVKTYIRSAYRKMGVERRTQAVLWGLAQGMESEPTPAPALVG